MLFQPIWFDFLCAPYVFWFLVICIYSQCILCLVFNNHFIYRNQLCHQWIIHFESDFTGVCWIITALLFDPWKSFCKLVDSNICKEKANISAWQLWNILNCYGYRKFTNLSIYMYEHWCKASRKYLLTSYRTSLFVEGLHESYYTCLFSMGEGFKPPALSLFFQIWWNINWTCPIIFKWQDKSLKHVIVCISCWQLFYLVERSTFNYCFVCNWFHCIV